MRTTCLTTLIPLVILSASCAYNGNQYGQTGAPVTYGGTAVKAAAYRQMLESDPNDSDARLGYATVLSWQGAYRAADRQYTTLLLQQPDNIAAMTGLAYNYIWSDRLDLAEHQFEQALDSAPNDFGVHKGLALTYLRSGRASQALEALKSQQLRPEDLEIQAVIETAEAGVTGGMTRRDHE